MVDVVVVVAAAGAVLVSVTVVDDVGAVTVLVRVKDSVFVTVAAGGGELVAVLVDVSATSAVVPRPVVVTEAVRAVLVALLAEVRLALRVLLRL